MSIQGDTVEPAHPSIDNLSSDMLPVKSSACACMSAYCQCQACTYCIEKENSSSSHKKISLSAFSNGTYIYFPYICNPIKGIGPTSGISPNQSFCFEGKPQSRGAPPVPTSRGLGPYLSLSGLNKPVSRNSHLLYCTVCEVGCWLPSKSTHKCYRDLYEHVPLIVKLGVPW